MGSVVCFTGQERAERLLAQEPSGAAPGHIGGRTLISLISPGTELNHGFLKLHDETYYPGYAAVFEADRIGDGVEGVKLGDKFFCMGPHRSFQHVPAKETILIPDGLGLDTAVFVRLMNIGLTALSTTSAKPGEKVIVSGAGPVGLLAALAFRRCGYEVGVCEPSAERRTIAASVGLPLVWDAFPLENPEWAGRTALVLDCSGHEAAVLDGCRIVRRQGEVVLCGVPWKAYSDATAQELLSLVFHGYVVLRSGWEWSLPLHADEFSPRGLFDNMRKGLNWLAELALDSASLSRRFSPSEAQRVYTALAAREIQEPFVLFDWTEQETGGDRS